MYYEEHLTVNNMYTIKEKRRQIVEFAYSLGVCKACLYREAVEGKKACQRCLKRGVVYSLKNRRKDGSCSRCGGSNESNKKTCERCRTSLINKRITEKESSEITEKESSEITEKEIHNSNIDIDIIK